MTGLNALQQTTTNYYYDNLLHLQPTRVITTDSKGETLKQQLNYPQDMVNNGTDPTGVYTSMSGVNIISPLIQSITSNNGTQITNTQVNYNQYYPNVFEPQTVQFQKGTNASEIRLNYHNYDNTGNLTSVSQQNGPLVSYLWGYNKAYPVARITNAAANDVFYEGFEDGNGTVGTFGNAKTGHYSHGGSYSKNLAGFDPGSYTFSYWLNPGSGWVLQSSTVTVGAGGTFAISLSGQVDDIRFYPTNAQITTYTYDPLVGMTSSTDTKNEITYYEYDSFQRLMNVKDQYGNIIKHTDYHYQGQ